MGQTISLSIPHRLTQQEARTRIQSGITDLRKQFGATIGNVEEQWTGDRLTFKLGTMGQIVTGRVEVLPDVVKLDIDLPGILGTLAGMLRGKIQQQATKMLENKK